MFAINIVFMSEKTWVKECYLLSIVANKVRSKTRNFKVDWYQLKEKLFVQTLLMNAMYIVFPSGHLHVLFLDWVINGLQDVKWREDIIDLIDKCSIWFIVFYKFRQIRRNGIQQSSQLKVIFYVNIDSAATVTSTI